MYQPDVILFDMDVPADDRFATIQLLRKAVSRAVIIVLSSFEEAGYADRALRFGADTFVRKDSMNVGLLFEIRRLRNTRKV